MFATIRRQFLPRLSRASLTEQLQPSRSISYNAASDITLVGSLHSQVRQISPDTKQFYFKTRNTFDNYTVHNIYLNQKLADDINIDFSPNEKLLILGNIRHQPFDRQDGKKGSAIRVKARSLYRCADVGAISQGPSSSSSKDGDTEKSSIPLDVNRVILSAQISFEMNHFKAYSVMNLAHHFRGSGDREEVIFLSVFLQDPKLQEYAQNQLKRLDFVQMQGSLSYKPYTDKQGKKRFDGRIIADRLCKIIPFATK